MERRDWLKSALVGTGAAAAGPLVSTIAPAPAAAAQAAAEAPWQPMLFDEHQNETVVVLSELIIPTTDTPGAEAAKVNEYIDLMLHDVDPDRGHTFLKGLGWLDGYAIRLHGSPFVALEEAQQVEILESLDGSDDPELKTGAEFFAKLKRITVEGYYTSRIGIAELNKHGVPASFGCDHDHA
ncbi:MAG: gluconate 2-dehydrogenase subunit 3 family protein [Bryobacterales bacterium]|nr:gluconate 2-dehydrogenase subunit 3 family protein [Bryobacterales bacterium]